MKKSEKYQLTCVAMVVANTFILFITRDNHYLITANIFAASVFIIGALDK